MLARLRSFMAALTRRSRFEDGMADELRFHVDAVAADLERSGVPRAEAERRARLELGAVDSVKEACRQARGLRVLDELRQDLRLAIRTMAAVPVAAAAAVVSLALGIGANTALFGFADAVFLRTMPVHRPHDLFYLGHYAGPATSSNYPLFERYATAAVFDGVTAYRLTTVRVVTREAVEPVRAQFVSGNYHAVLGVPLALGRGFSAEPDRDLSRPPTAVISDGYWARRFGRSPDAIGRTVNVSGRTVEIVGVTAPGFHGLDSESRIDLTLPISMMALDAPGFFDDHTGWLGLRIIARRASGTTEARALAAAEALFAQYMREPEQAWVRQGPVTGRFERAALLPAARGSDGLRERMATPLAVLAALAGILLLIACANVANLLLARAAARRREVAVRVSLGASRRRLVRMYLTEGFVLALSGAACALPVAAWTATAILALLDAGPSPLVLDVSLNIRVLAFTIAAAVLAGICVTVGPALRATRPDAELALRGGASAPRAGGIRGRALVAAQIALCVLLLVAAGLLARSLRNLKTVDTGFDAGHVVLADVNTFGTEFTPERRLALYSDLAGRLARLPGVLSVSTSTRTPVDFSSQLRGIDVPGADVPGVHGVSLNIVSPAYFQTFGIQLRQGRGFTNADGAGGPLAAVVSEGMARFYFGAADPLGRSFSLGPTGPITIVGVVEDVRHERLTEGTPPKMVYLSLLQTRPVPVGGENAAPAGITVAIRTADGRGAPAGAIREQVRRLDRYAMVSYVRTMEHQLDAAMLRDRLLSILSAGLGGLALLLACVGLYGTLSYNVARRTREIGIRMALGAARQAVLRQMLRETLSMTLLGVTAGLLAALFAARFISAFLFELSPRDPLTLAAAVTILLATALASGYVPARKAASVDPAGVLKAE
jgi:predicted permease